MAKFKNLLILFFLVTFLTGCTKHSDKTVVKFASWGSQSEVAILKPILSEFERENPDIKVDFIHIPQNYFQKIHLLFASNLAPDVIFINNLYLPIYANAGVLQELGDEYMGDREERCKDAMMQRCKEKPTLQPSNPPTFFKKSLDALSYDGKLYAIPRDVSNLVIYYNKDLFDKYCIPYPKSDWTFEDFLKTAQELTKPNQWGISFEEDLLFYLPYLMSEGGGVLSDDLKSLIINTKESQKGLQFYSDLRNKYNVAPKQAQSASATMAQLFLQQQLAMHLSGRWLVPKYREDAKFRWDVINFPRGDKGSIVPMDASGWAVAKSSKHKEAAAKLIKYLSSKESIEKFTKSGLIVPARIDVAQSEIFLDKNKSPKNSQVFIDVIKTSKKTPVSVDYREVQDELKERTNYLFNRN